MLLFYLIRRLSSLLDTHFVSMDPRNYSWLEKNDFLLPDKCLCQIPLDFLKICKSCKGCSTKRYVYQNTSWKLHNVMVLVQNVKIFTTLCTNDWSFERNRLLFVHISSPWLFWTNFTLFCTEIGDQGFTYIELLVSLQLWNEINKVQIWYKLVTCYVVLIKFIKNRYCSKYLHIAYSWIPLP